ncbi:MAG TPA: LPS assembly lipoprotein LptE [Gammaproteobacteria bacterium]|nr:LPS assembly lipoprotein LptE [Gammaproteobacteria bacterium]
MKAINAGRHVFAVFALSGLLTACGYHLQGARNLPPVMQRTTIVAGNPYSDLVRGLTRALSGANVEVVQTPQTATAVLKIINDTASRRVISVDSHDRPQAYELHYAVKFSVLHNDTVLLPSQTVSLTRDYVFDPDNVLAGNQEARRLLDAMRSDLVRVILRRLAAVKAAKPANSIPPPTPLS